MAGNYTHLIFIVNEFSRKGKHTRKAIRDHMLRYSLTYEIHTTQYKRHAVELACTFSDEKADDCLIIAVGGDGTLNEVVEGICRSAKKRAVSYLPTGSGNDFARSHDLSRSIEISLERILSKAEETELDVITGVSDAENLIAVNSLGFGIDGMVIAKLDNNKKKKTAGKFSYLLSVFSAYFAQKSFSMSIHNESLNLSFDEILLIVCANNKYFGGGIPIHPLADPQDQYIDIVIAEKVSFLELLQILYRILSSESHLSHKKIHTYRVKSCTLKFDTPQYGQRDGELIEKHTHLITIDTIKQHFWV